ncbi:META domain-containing protein [Ralstonia sp. UBA689]|uniref:META domain-containing protein n=1 Tax=Ralstonia sp. UBA689 TaxID=1947373 RepID=UPI0025EA03A5|nr:META domain-containing protein [Ralstonia sp. UBA689]
MFQSNRPKPSLLQTPRRVVLAAAALAALTAASIIGAGCMTPTASTKPAATVASNASAPVAQAASTPEAKPVPASAAPNTGQATLAQAQGEGRSRFVLVRWQEPGAAPKELPSGEGEGADPATEPLSIEFSTGLEAANGVASGYSGCNRFSGPYEKLTSGMRFGNLATTRMVCDPARMELETAFLEALKTPLATVGMQPSPAGVRGRQVIWKTATGALLQFAERPLPAAAPAPSSSPSGQNR